MTRDKLSKYVGFSCAGDIVMTHDLIGIVVSSSSIPPGVELYMYMWAWVKIRRHAGHTYGICVG